MIIVRIHGGLGNQMFQYAMGRHLSLRTGAPLWFETGGYNPSPLGRFDLDRFHTVGKTVSAPLAVLLRRIGRLGGAVGTRWVRVVALAQPLHRICVQKTIHFDPHALELRPPVYLIGYWQCERYFKDIADVIRSDFAVKGEPSAENQRVLDRIAEEVSVCVHVRRTDYVTNPTTAGMYGVRGVPYYRAASKLIADRVSGLHYFVFSDDIPWARENLTFLERATFVDHNSPADRHEDMRLMMQCKHFIIANSSFSWWPAWLSTHPEKVVVASQTWFSTTDAGTNDILPPSWLRV